MNDDSHNDEQELDLDAESVDVLEEEIEDPMAAGSTNGDIDPEIEQEIKRVIIEEEPTKAKAQLIPEQLINKELEPDDLFDAGSI